MLIVSKHTYKRTENHKELHFQMGIIRCSTVFRHRVFSLHFEICFINHDQTIHSLQFSVALNMWNWEVSSFFVFTGLDYIWLLYFWEWPWTECSKNLLTKFKENNYQCRFSRNTKPLFLMLTFSEMLCKWEGWNSALWLPPVSATHFQDCWRKRLSYFHCVDQLLVCSSCFVLKLLIWQKALTFLLLLLHMSVFRVFFVLFLVLTFN